jgi:hypothetical protein
MSDTEWWCWECQGLGGWEEDGADRGDFGATEDVECPCCGGDGYHYGGSAPDCAPSAGADAERELLQAAARKKGPPGSAA